MEDRPKLSSDLMFRAVFLGELSLVGVAALIGYGFADEPFPFRFELHFEALWQSSAASAPMLLLAVLATSKLALRFRPLRRIYEVIRGFAGDAIRDMTVLQLILLSVAAGVGEESLFRGVMQPLIEEQVPAGGIVISSFIFALFHAVTWTYFVLAFLISVYFGWLFAATGNLVPPVVAHAVYDALALYLLRRRLAQEDEDKSPRPVSSGDDANEPTKSPKTDDGDEG